MGGSLASIVGTKGSGRGFSVGAVAVASAEGSAAAGTCDSGEFGAAEGEAGAASSGGGGTAGATAAGETGSSAGRLGVGGA